MKDIHLGAGFAAGADISWLPMMEATGFKFKDRDGKEGDLLAILRGFGLNSVRLRSWVHPSQHPLRGHCSTEETLAFALRCQKAGLKDVMVDFHYGDSWCDPGHQIKPKAWQDLPFDALVEAVYEYSRDAVKTFVDGGFTPAWVQLGNETNPGMLLPDGSTDDFGKLARLYNAGHKGVKESSPSTKTIIHLAEGNATGFCVNYFDNLKKHGCDAFDMIGLSYYPWWLKKKNAEVIDDLEKTLHALPARFDKDVIIVEIGGEDVFEDESFDTLYTALEKCATEPRCRGMFYWEPEGAKTWSDYALSAWRADGTPTKAMDAYLCIKE